MTKVQYASPPLACNLTALGSEERAAHQALTAKLFRSAQSVERLPNGLALRFPNETPTLRRLADFIANEERCCPFLTFDIRVEPQKAELRLSITGTRSISRFIKAEFADLMKS